MKALTIKPFWANLIINGVKKIENRSWGKNVRGDILIHQGGKGGGIIGIVNVVDVVDYKTALKMFPEQKEYISGSLCWVLENPRKIKFISCKGKLSLWNFDKNFKLEV